MSVEGRRPRHKPDGDSHNGSAADSDSARGSSILSSPTTPQQPSCCGFSLRGVAQLVARLVRDQEAVGSNPVTPTISLWQKRCHRLIFLLYRRKMAISTADFQVAFYRDVQRFSGCWTLLLPLLPAKFWIMAGEWAVFWEKPEFFPLFSECFQFPRGRFSAGCGDFCFSRQFSVCFQVFHFTPI